uniref:Ig-like domain-containing protein n=1 Tax=Magallana gigas TaxID=29159 RepID=A0A8W8LW43_MAGGI
MMFVRKKTNIISNSVLCRVIQLLLLVCVLMTSYAYATISIQVTDRVIIYGKTDIDILCIVNGTSLESTDGIQLKKSNTNTVSISEFGTIWQDKILETRSQINASIKNVQLSYLRLTILACNVERTDEATYSCDLTATKEDFSNYYSNSTETSLNITGFVDEKTDKCGKYASTLKVLNTRMFQNYDEADIFINDLIYS